MDIDRNTLARYFTGESSGDEKNSIREWLESSEEHKRRFINERIRFDASVVVDEDSILHSRSGMVKRIAWRALKVASVILLLTGSGYLLRLYNSSQAEVITQTIYVPAGSRTSLVLPDGSSVWLNSNTTLKYPNLFSTKKRIVELDGEAYFEIAKAPKKTFTVLTNKYNIEVSGTTFNVEAYTGKPAFTTALFTGRVKLYKEKTTDTLYLKPGETAKLIDNMLIVSSLDSDIYKWKDGLIIIEDKSFEEIMQLFEKYFGQEIIIRNNKVKDLGYRGKLRITDGVDHALKVLQNDFRFTYKREEETNQIFIY
jgi:ferric-dicitrate binding protein FerR (iron transport regulator)